MSDLEITIDRNDGTAPFLIPIQPGCTEIQGTCGLGKSLTLEMINVLADGDQKDRIKATAGKSGTTVKGLGVTLTLSQSRAVVKGDLDVGAAEDYPLEGLIYPPRQGETEKNEYGIKCFVQMSKSKADPAAFHHLIGTAAEFNAAIPPDAIKTNDLVSMAGKVKRAIQAFARKAAADAEREEQSAAGDRDAMKGLDAKTETDPTKLQQVHTAAVQRHAKLKTEWDAYCDGQAAAEEARKKLAAATGGATTAAECEANEAEKKTAYEAATAKVKAIEDELRIAKAEAMSAYDSLQSAIKQTNAAKRISEATAGWQSAIDAMAGAKEPDLDALSEAETAVETAQRAIEQGAVVRAALDRERKAAEHQKRADEFRKQAHKLNMAADGTDAVLSKAVNSTRFSVSGEFLMGHLPDGTIQPLYTMSDGQRSLLCILEKIERLVANDLSPRLKLADIGQRIRQDLPDSIWEELCRYAYERNTCLVCARVTDDPTLRAVVWQPKGGA